MSLCECGRGHKPGVRHTVIGSNALQSLPGILAEAGCKNVLLAADANTYPLAGKKIACLLNEFNLREFIYDDNSLIPDEKAVGRLLIATMSDDGNAPADMILTLGAGTLNDLCRYVSFRMGIPYIIICTAPSMDGYASNVSPLIVNSLKITYEASIAYAVIGDTDLLCTAPDEMISAGFGDIVGKYNCLNDWELGRIVNGEYYCETVAGLTKTSIETCVAKANGLASKTPESVEALMNGLILSGVAMSYVGNSRPASGSEHHLSHFWEMMFLFDGRAPVLHGAKVGVATLVMIRLLELLLKENIDWDSAIRNADTLSESEFNNIIGNIYKQAAPGIILAAEKSGRNRRGSVCGRLHVYRDNWPLILETIRKNIPAYEFVKELLEKTNSPVSPVEIGVRKDEFINGVLYAKEIRQRYTVLQLAGDLGLLTAYAESLAGFFYE